MADVRLAPGRGRRARRGARRGRRARLRPRRHGRLRPRLPPCSAAGCWLGASGAAMLAFALGFNRVVRRLIGQPLISVIMVTLGLGALMRGAAPFLFAHAPAGLPLHTPQERLVLLD